ncbi:MAG: PKD domain-containing protein [Flavobacteriales bacterium]
MNAHDAFERAVKGTLEPFEVPYNSADWAQLEERLDKSGVASGRKPWGLLALLLGGSAIVVTTVLLTTAGPSDGGTVAEVTEAPAPAPIGAPEPEAQPAAILAEATTEEASEQMTTDTDVAKAAAVVQPPRTADKASSNGKVGAPSAPPDEPVATAVPPTTAERSDQVSIRASISEGCPGTSIDFAAENLPAEGIYLWNFGDGSFSNKARPSHVFSKAGTFEVMLSHSSVGGSSVKNKPAADRIVIHELPNATFSFLKQEYENSVPSVHFENRSQGAVSYHWDFGDGNTSTVPHPDHIYKKAGEHTVVLTVTNAQGCTDRTERKVRIASDYNLLAPNTFSPNGDGVDDLFIPEALKGLGVRFKLSVHDPRSGQLVYETSDATRPWNGRIGNKGEPCTPGDYVWMVEMKDGEKLGGTYNGTVGLLR